MKIGIIQIEPVYLDAKATWNKLKERIIEVANSGAKLITFGETLIPGYPSWVSVSYGAKFNDTLQKEIYAKYYSDFSEFKSAISACLSHTHDTYKEELDSLLRLNFQSFKKVDKLAFV